MNHCHSAHSEHQDPAHTQSATSFSLYVPYKQLLSLLDAVQSSTTTTDKYSYCRCEHTHTHTQSFYCSFGVCPGLPGWDGTRKVKPGRVKPIWIYWSKRWWVAVASAGLYASLHLIPDNDANIPSLRFLQAGCPSCHPTNSVKALKENTVDVKLTKKN